MGIFGYSIFLLITLVKTKLTTANMIIMHIFLGNFSKKEIFPIGAIFRMYYKKYFK